MSKVSKNPAAIVGVGHTDYSMNSGRSTLVLAVEACREAMQDAGLGVADVDGVLTFNTSDSVSAEAVSTALALENVFYSCEWYAGRTSPRALVELAELLVNAERCKAVLVFRSMNGQSRYRLGESE